MTEARIARKTRDAAKTTLTGSRPSSRTGTASKPPIAGSNGNSKAASVVSKVKHKLVRDSFTIPKAEYEILEGLKDRAANLRRPTKKSELLRAGVAALHAMTDKAFLSVLNGVQSLKTGRPKDQDKATSES